jgi:hypothetical protein
MMKLNQLMWLTMLCVSTTIVSIANSNKYETVDLTAIICKTVEVAGLVVIAHYEQKHSDKE